MLPSSSVAALVHARLHQEDIARRVRGGQFELVTTGRSRRRRRHSR